MNVPGRGTNGGTKLRPKGHQFVQSVQFVEIAKSLVVMIFGEKNKKPGPPRGGRAQPGRTTLARDRGDAGGGGRPSRVSNDLEELHAMCRIS
jgi:hypothetical protein